MYRRCTGCLLEYGGHWDWHAAGFLCFLHGLSGAGNCETESGWGQEYVLPHDAKGANAPSCNDPCRRARRRAWWNVRRPSRGRRGTML
jgi:hypothetical protein